MRSLLVFPQQLQLRHREKIGAGPDLDEEELAEGEDHPSLPRVLGRGGRGGRTGPHILHSFVEGVGGVVAAV